MKDNTRPMRVEGNFAFNFFIALKAAPDLKFDYNRRTYRPGS